MRRGYIIISPEIMKDGELLSVLFRYFKVLEIRYDFMKNAYACHVEGELCREIKEGEPLPQYSIEVTSKKDEFGKIEYFITDISE